MPDAEISSSAEAASDLTLLAEAARKAGQMALGYFRRDPVVWSKANDSPVSEADLAVDGFLGNELRAARPEYGWLSEETTDDKVRLSRHRLFVVDPIDGTRAFLNGGDDWTVSVAVVEAGRPLAAALYAPVPDEMFLAAAGGGATLNGTPMRVSGRAALAGAGIVGPRSLRDRSVLRDAGLVQRAPVRSLALRIAMVAAGRCDAAIATARAHDWDLAAADLLVQEAGGRLTDLDGDEIIYNRPDIRHPPLIAAPPALAIALSRVVRELL